MKIKSLATSFLMVTLCGSMLLSGGCSSMKNAWNGMSQAGQGATAGAAGGAAVGAGVGAILGGGKGTWIGALVGSAIGAGTGALVGNSMDRQKKALEDQLGQLQAQQDQNSKDIQDIKVQMVKDRNDLDAIKLVLGDAILFKTNQSSLSPSAQSALERIAYNLNQFPDTDVTVVGYTDNTGSQAVNDKLSLQRAQSVMNDLEKDGVAASRLKAVGKGWNDPVASNATPEGRAQNRRVEIFITADQKMIENAQKESNNK